MLAFMSVCTHRPLATLFCAVIALQGCGGAASSDDASAHGPDGESAHPRIESAPGMPKIAAGPELAANGPSEDQAPAGAAQNTPPSQSTAQLHPGGLTDAEMILIESDPKSLTPEKRRERAYALRKRIMADPNSGAAKALQDAASGVSNVDRLHPNSGIPENE